MAMDANISAEDTAAKLKAQGGKCVNCGHKFGGSFKLTSPNGIVYHVTNPNDYCINLSHIVPESRGGKLTPDNTLLKHGICNRDEQDYDLEFYCDYRNTYLTYAEMIACKDASLIIAQNLKAGVRNQDTIETAAIALTFVKETYPRMFSVRMSDKRKANLSTMVSGQ